MLEKLIERDYGIRIPHNTIYKVLLNHGLVEENMNKKKKKWALFRTLNPMSLWQGYVS
jgi:putative transposase